MLSHAELVEIAAESGIDREALERATAELAQSRMQELARQVVSSEIAAERVVQLKRFAASAVSFSIFNGFLYFVASRFTGGTWYVWPFLGSGVLLALQVRHVIFPYDKDRAASKPRRETARARAAASGARGMEARPVRGRDRRGPGSKGIRGGGAIRGDGVAEDRYAQAGGTRRAPRETARPLAETVKVP